VTLPRPARTCRSSPRKRLVPCQPAAMRTIR
jgi:hypothetical protein